ncbi:MAG: tRNA pseudouridine(13) synthase TruD [Promethearchaeota archaeon]
MIELADDDLNPQKKKLKIEFSLQKGSYATMLIRELIK